MEQPPNRVAVFQQVIDEFNNSHPDIHVTQQVQDWNTIFSKIGAAVSSGTQPDICMPPATSRPTSGRWATSSCR